MGRKAVGMRVRQPVILKSPVDVRHNSRNTVKFILDNWMLILVALTSGALLLWPALQGALRRRALGPECGAAHQP